MTASIMHREIILRVELAGWPTATFVRGLIHKDIARDHDVMNKRLARMIIYSAVACRMLQSRIGLEGKVRTTSDIAAAKIPVDMATRPMPAMAYSPPAIFPHDPTITSIRLSMLF